MANVGLSKNGVRAYVAELLGVSYCRGRKTLGLNLTIGSELKLVSDRYSAFDSDFYTQWYPEASGMTPEEAQRHYYDVGAEKGFFPTFLDMIDNEFPESGAIPANFDWEFYIRANPEVPDTLDKWQAAAHYLIEGKQQGFAYRSSGQSDFLIELDPEWYSEIYGVKREDAERHFGKFGRPNVLSANPRFDALAYLEGASDVAVSGIDPLQHYLRYGRAEGRGASSASPVYESERKIFRPSAVEIARSFFEFDPSFYRKLRRDLAQVGWTDSRLEEHYLHYGEKEGGRPNEFFDPEFYRSTYGSALGAWKHSLLEHFLSVGLLRGFAPSEEVANGMKTHSFSSAIEWVGYWKGIPGMESVRTKDRVPAALLSVDKPDPVKAKAGVKRLNWVIPPFSKGGGGHTTIFRAARTFTRLGWESVFWVTGSLGPTQLDSLTAEYIGYFPQSPVSFRSLQDGFLDVEGEVLVATAWQTAYEVQKNVNSNARLYFVQDRESLFEAAGADAMRADFTYRMGFDFVCAGKWLKELVEPFGGESTHFELCASPSFSSEDLPLEKRKTLAAIYVRGSSPRRATDLMVETANRLAATGIGRVVVFGDGSADLGLDAGVENLGVLTNDEMASLFQETRFGLAASATNYSILPGELAAAGSIVVQPASSTIVETTVAHGAVEVEPSADAMVEYIVATSTELTQSKFDEIRSPYMDFVQSISWEQEFEAVSDWMEEICLSGNYETVLERKSVGVIIPTYYPTEKFTKIVERVNDQLTSFDVTIQIVDSRLDGRKSDVIDDVERRGLAHVTAIDAANFSHGPTRTFGARLLETDFYAYLTDDSMPADEYWLESLVSPLVMIPTCGYSFGRHKAYPEHPSVYATELKDHFDNLEGQGFVLSRHRYGERYDEEGYLRASVAYNSDNSAAYPGHLLRELGFPPVDFAEDQAWAKMVLDRGYSRVFANTSLIYHSHNYIGAPEEAFKRGAEEAAALFVNFGLVRYKNPNEVFNAKQATEASWRPKSVGIGLDEQEFRRLIEAKFASIDGAWSVCRDLLTET